MYVPYGRSTNFSRYGTKIWNLMEITRIFVTNSEIFQCLRTDHKLRKKEINLFAERERKNNIINR